MLIACMFHFWQMLLAQLEGERERAENMEIQKLKLELQIERDRAAKLEANLSDQSNRDMLEEQARQSRLHMVDTELETAKLEVRTSIVELKLPHTHSNIRWPPQCLMHDCLKKIL